MESLVYNWKRFWYPRGSIASLIDGGYLRDPQGPYSNVLSPHVVPFASIASTPCLVLLAEPGMGKTETMKLEKGAIDAAVVEQGGRTLWLNLRSYSSDALLVNDLFMNPTFRAWCDGSHHLHLFLDSLDEALLRIDTLAPLLVDRLAGYPVERLALRIACRTAEWPTTFEEGLKELWGKDQVGVYELAPLRHVDVAEAARVHTIDPETFLQLVNENNAVPFAIKPVTLKFLLNTYLQSQAFPSTQTDLYLKGCRLLAAEDNKYRRDARKMGAFSPDQRLYMAGRIAAVTVFANRYAVWTDTDRGDVPEEDVPLSDLLVEEEALEGTAFSEAALRETLGTALFSSRGEQRMGWAHQTYAEVLAAWYVIQQRMTSTQIMSLLVHSDGKIVPQLHEVAAWLASMNSDIFRRIMQIEPYVLLRSDVATVDESDRQALVASLLGLFDAEQLLDRNRGLYRRLRHSDIADQVRPYIRDQRKGVLVRRAAIHIAEECRVQEVQDELVMVALDQSDDLIVRRSAAYAIARMGDDTVKAKLKPLAVGDAGADPEDELKGCGLMAVWPVHLTADELFSALQKPKSESLFGAYQGFILNHLLQHLQPAHLPAALEWVVKQPERYTLRYTFRKPLNYILLQAWQHLDVPGVLPLFAKAAWSRLKHHEHIVDQTGIDRVESSPSLAEMLRDDDEKRRRVALAVLPLLSSTNREWVSIVFSATPLVMRKDVPWIITQLSLADSVEEQTKWALLLAQVFDRQDLQQLEHIYEAYLHHPILAEQFSGLFNPIRLDSEQARRLKADYYEQLERQKRGGNPLLDPPPTVRVARALEQFESGNMDGWWILNLELMLEPDSPFYTDLLAPDLTQLPGWKAADTETQARIIQAAKQYVIAGDPATDRWLGTNTIYHPAFAGYRAIRLLLDVDQQFLETLSADQWQKWAPIILAYPTSNAEKERDIQEVLVYVAYQLAPNEIIRSLLVLIDEDNKQGEHLFNLSKVSRCWDAQLKQVLLDKLRDKKLKPQCVAGLLEELLKYQASGAYEFALTLIPIRMSKRGKARQKAISAARLLVYYSKDAGWPVLWPALLRDTGFGREVISALAHGGDRFADHIGQKLTEEQLAELFLWLEQQYPRQKDPKHDQLIMHEVTPRESIGQWRDGILRHLQYRGTYEACTALQRIAHELPHLDWLKWTILEAQTTTRRRTWVAPHPTTIIRLARNEQVRLVQSGEHLLSVIIESLERLEKKLQGQTPAAQFLWDNVGKATYRPKDENAFSDYVKLHLDEDIRERGIIINREVEIRRGIGGKGERTDIHVNAITKETKNQRYDVVTVIIEVKGSWHPEVLAAMQTQLVDRYLKDNECHHGLYLVGWFNCHQWKDEPGKRRAIKLGEDKQDVQKQLDDQAGQLSQQWVVVKAKVIDVRLR